MGQKLSLCTSNAVEDSCIRLQCAATGGSACLVDVTTGLLQALMNHMQQIVVKSVRYDVDKQRMVYEELRLSAVEALLNALGEQRQDVCFKAFVKAPIAHKEEVQNIYRLKTILKEAFNTHTTYREIGGAYAFEITAAAGTKLTFKVDNVELKPGAYIILNQRCQRSIENDRVPAAVLMEDIMVVLRKMHGAGYAHMDVKPQNIVYCENDAVKYKLIDYEGMQPTTNNNGVNASSLYYSPILTVGMNAISMIQATDDVVKEVLSRWKKALGTSSLDFETYAEVFVRNYIEYKGRVDDAYLNSKSDDYALAITLHAVGNGDAYIADLLKANVYGIALLGGRGAPKRADRRFVSTAGRLRALYIGTHGKHFVRIKGGFVAVAELRAVKK